MLLLSGFLLSSILGCSSSFRSGSTPKTAANPPGPTVLQSKTAAIPLLDARVTKLVFFNSSAADIGPSKNPTYSTRFEHTATTRIHPEIYLEYPPPGKRVYFTMTVYIRQNTKMFRIVDYDTRIEPDWTSSHHSVGIGVFGPGNWRVGNYEADVYINGEKVAMGYFQVY
jgi:hypothetical protein